MNNRIIIIGILFSFLVLGFPKTNGSVFSSESIFNLELLGYTNGEYFIPLPVPPNYNGTIAPADIFGFKELIFQLSYHGLQVSNITSMSFWQTINTYETLWNLTTNRIDPNPPFLIKPNQSLEFMVKTDYYFVSGWKFTLKIVTKTQGSFVLQTPFSSQLTHYLTWPLSTTTDSLSYDPMLFFLIWGIFLMKRRGSVHK